MIYYPDFLKFKESELQAHLEEHNKFVAPGGLVVYNNEIAEIYGRAKPYLLIKTENNNIMQVYTSDAPLLTIDRFNRLKLYRRTRQLRGNYKFMCAVLKRIAHQIYGENRVDIILEPGARRIQIIIHYPEIEITNSTGTKHIIKDLYIRHHFVNTEAMGIQLAGQAALKTTYSNGEIQRSYLHSHISNNGLGSWSNSFCFGSTTFAQFIQNVRQRGEMNQADIYQLFFGMDEYLKWESIEGTPYNRLNDIMEFTSESYSVSYSNDLAEKAYAHVVQNLENFEYSITMRNNEVRIEITTSLESALSNFLETSGRKDLILRVHNGSPVRVVSAGRSNSRYNNTRLDFTFKGARQVLKVDYDRGSPEAIERLHPLRVYPQFYIAVKVKLENKFETFLSEKQKQTQQAQ